MINHDLWQVIQENLLWMIDDETQILNSAYINWKLTQGLDVTFVQTYSEHTEMHAKQTSIF